jgi:3beta-hydroxysteroid-4beta-carboxylate 3-dehydrogenase (decarboxylating)
VILVTGATGHLGANLVRRLLADAEDVRVLLRDGSDTRAVEGLAVERTWGDVRDPRAVRAAVRGCRQVHHCAARVSSAHGHHREIYETNVVGTRHVLEAALAAGVERVVVTGSFSAVGHTGERPADETVAVDPFARLLPYQRSKVAVEHECLRALADGLDVVIATSCAILGPNDFVPSRMGRLLLDFARGRLRAYIPGGFEFVAARDIAAGHLLAMAKGRPGQKYIFSTEFVTVDALMETYEAITGRARPRLRLPGPLMLGLAHATRAVLRTVAPRVEPRFTPGAVRLLMMQRRADITKARAELGYAPTSIRDAIREQYEFFRGLGWLPDVPGPA